jgi:hypothetical protein
MLIADHNISTMAPAAHHSGHGVLLHKQIEEQYFV